MTEILSVRDLRVTLDTASGPLQAVRGVDLSVGRGETLCIVGESGCGKSMTALSLMDLLPRTARRSVAAFAFEGAPVPAKGPRSMARLRGDQIAMIFQEPMTALNPTFRIGDQLVAVYRTHRRASTTEARARAITLLERVGIPNPALRLGQYPHEMSGGLRQRVMIAMALMCQPSLIIADEPTTALDVTIQAQILALLKDLQADFGMGLVLITHDLGVVAHIADRVAVMYAGRIVEQGPVGHVLGQPHHPYTQGLLAAVPRPGVHKPGDRLGTIPGTVPSLIGGIAGCAFRDRCPRAVSACADRDPALAPIIGGEVAFACWNPVLAAPAAAEPAV